MPNLESATSRYHSLRGSRQALVRLAPVVRYTLFAVGVSFFLDQARPLLDDAQFTWGERRLMGVLAFVTLGGFGLAGWVAGRLLRTSAELIEVFVDGAEAAARTTYLIESQLVPSLNRAVLAMERLATGRDGDCLDPGVAAVRGAIRVADWDRAERLLQSVRIENADTLSEELERARQGESDTLSARLDAAIANDDPVEVIDCRDALTHHLRGEPLRSLDRRVVRWLANTVRDRAKAGQITPELAKLAAKTADSFADTPEGAAIQTALPGLRRRAGLCPSCVQPYRGPGDACPDCSSDVDESPPPPWPRPENTRTRGRL
jgi:hypothetical protein